MEFAKIQYSILVNEDKLKVYGMQFRYNAERNLEPFPIINPEYVDRRRLDFGLESLNEYLKRKINYDWTVEQKEREWRCVLYKQELPIKDFSLTLFYSHLEFFF